LQHAVDFGAPLFAGAQCRPETTCVFRPVVVTDALWTSPKSTTAFPALPSAGGVW
jgi:hypothetical protein